MRKIAKVFAFYRTEPDELYWFDLRDQWEQVMARKITEAVFEIE